MTKGMTGRKQTSTVVAACASAFAAAFALAACNQAETRSGPLPPPPAVAVTALQAQPLPLSFSYSGRVAAYREVEVRGRVTGILMKHTYVEGATVRAGDVLFHIDPASYEAEVARAQAQLQQAQAQLIQAERDQQRAVTLFERRIGSEKARDDAISAVELAKAAVAAAAAQLNIAKINLSYTSVVAPLEGIAGLKVKPEGSLVTTDTDSSLLTRITQVDPVYVNFAFSDGDLNEIHRLLRAGRGDIHGRLRVTASVGDGRVRSEGGFVDFIDPNLDLQTGTVRARATIPNSQGVLRPGHFVRIEVTGVTLDDAIVVPQAAVMQGPQGQYVYALDSGDRAELRPIVIGRDVGQGWIVKSGLSSGDRVITEGTIKVRPGAPVRIAGDEPAAVRAAQATP